MFNVFPFIEDFKKFNKPEINDYYDTTISKLLYKNHSIESDYRALIEKAAQLKKKYAEIPHLLHHSLFHSPDYKSIKAEQKKVLDELEKLNSFLRYLLQSIPSSKEYLESCIENNEYYLRLFRA